MDGDFKGDFTRDTFAPFRHFSRVLMQQGRVQLDADWNEQTDLLLYAQRTFIKDLVGPHWGTFDFDVDDTGKVTAIEPNSFKIDLLKVNNIVQGHDFSIGKGHYYIDGILSVLSENTTYQKQEPQQPIPMDDQYLIYLDVWERQITFLENQDIREVALGGNGPDTATRAEVVQQVKLLKLDSRISEGELNKITSNVSAKVHFVETHTKDLESKLLQPKHRGKLRARGRAQSQDNSDPCTISPAAQFRGNENQLYRVEIHTGGTKETATFKWSRENGSVVFPIVSVGTNAVTIENLGRDNNLSLEVNDWVEIIDDDYILQVAALEGPGSPPPLHGSVNPLLQVGKIEVDNANPANVLVTLKSVTPDVGKNLAKHPVLRRWDQKDGTGKQGGRPKLDGSGTINIVEGTKEDTWLTLEDGVQIQFQPDDSTMIYRTGDYWLIPARTIIGDVLWPQEINQSTGFGHPKELPPHGVKHHYALLAVITFNGSTVTVDADLRYMVPPLGKLATILDIGSTIGLDIETFKKLL